MSEPVDLKTVAAARGRLDALAEQHPHLVGESSAANRDAWEVLLREDRVSEPMEMFAVRLPRGLIKRLEAYTKRLEREGPGIPVRTSDAVRLLLTKALDEAEKHKR